jgi:ABC-type multidrug transport system permease subunit
MPFFFASNALYSVAIVPGWLQVVSAINPVRYEIVALRADCRSSRRAASDWISRC